MKFFIVLQSDMMMQAVEKHERKIYTYKNYNRTTQFRSDIQKVNYVFVNNSRRVCVYVKIFYKVVIPHLLDN